MKKKILLTLILVFMFFIGNIDIVEASQLCYGSMDEGNDYTIFTNQGKNGNLTLSSLQDRGFVTMCVYEDPRDIVGLAWHYTFTMYKNTKSQGKTMFCLKSNAGTASDGNEFYGTEANDKSWGLSKQEVTNLCSGGKCVCPIGYITASDNRGLYWGVGSTKLRDGGYDEFYPKEGVGALVCLGSREQTNVIDHLLLFDPDDPYAILIPTLTDDDELVDEFFELTSGSITEAKNLDKKFKGYFNINNGKAEFKNQEMAEKLKNSTYRENFEKEARTLYLYTYTLQEQQEMDKIWLEQNKTKITIADEVLTTCDPKCGAITTEYCDKVKKYEKIYDIFELSSEDYKAILNLIEGYYKKNGWDSTKISENLKDTANLSKTIEEYAAPSTSLPKIDIETIAPLSCEGLFDPILVETLKWILNIVRIAIPILLIVMCTIDFGQAMISNEQDEMKKATSKVIKRIIAALVVFLIPTLVRVLLDMPGISDYVSTEQKCESLIFGNSEEK